MHGTSPEVLFDVISGGLKERYSKSVAFGSGNYMVEDVNGIYEPVTEVYNGKLLFQKRGIPDVWLRFEASTRFWVVSSTADKDSKKNLGWCHYTD